MRIEQLFEESIQYEVRKIKQSDSREVQKFADFYNDSGQLTWRLNVNRLRDKIGSMGRMWGLYIKDSDVLVGTIAVKEIEPDLVEVGYLMVHPEHRSFQNFFALYKTALKFSKRFDNSFTTTNVKNKTINRLVDRIGGVKQVFVIRSPFGGGRNTLYVWTHKDSDIEGLRQHFKQNIIQEL